MSRMIIAAFTVVVAALAPVGSALAHTGLTGSEPVAGETVPRPPRTVTLTFSEAPLPNGAALVAQGPQGSVPLQPRVTGNSVVAAWPQQQPAGAYTVTYRVVASDGHPITGKVEFRIARNPAASATASSAPAPTSSAAAAEPTEPSDPAGVPFWIWAAGAVLLVAGGYVAVSRGRRTGD